MTMLRGAAALVVLASFLMPVGLHAAELGGPDPAAGADSALVSLPTAAPDSLEESPSKTERVTPPGGEIGTACRGLSWIVSSITKGTRIIGTGWDGHASAVTAGVLPPSFTRLAVRGRRADDWISGGLDLPAACRPAPGVLLVPGGHDLSTWPVLTAERPSAESALSGAGIFPLSVNLRPGRPSPEAPFSRLNLETGADGRKATALEFGRRYRDGGSSTSLFTEKEEGRAPVPGGGYEIDRAGALFSAVIASEWRVEVSGTRVDLARGIPYPGLGLPGLSRVHVRSDLLVAATDGSSRFELFHTQSWLEPGSAAGAVSTECDGAFVGLAERGVFRDLSVQFERRSAGGDALAEDRDALAALVVGRIDVIPGGESLSLTAGLDVLGSETTPLVGVRYHPVLPGGIDWYADARFSGRHPTAMERWLVPTAVPESGDAGLVVAGNSAVGPERALTLSTGLLRKGTIVDVGADAQLARVLDPIVLACEEGDHGAPVNDPDETGAAVSLWAAAGDPSRGTARLGFDWVDIEDAGALNSFAPVPEAAVTATASAPWSLFEDYVVTRWEVSSVFEWGRSRGSWMGVADDSRTTVDLRLTGAAGSADFYVAVRDLFELDRGQIASLDPGGRAFSAGFSWRFWD